MSDRETTRQKPYLLRAMHEWMTDNDLTPHIVVDASVGALHVPEEHVQDGKIVLNVSYAATRQLTLGNELVAFEARFNGVPFSVSIPIDGVLGIYARETGRGMVFTEEGSAPPPDGSDPSAAKTQKPKLKVVK
jgi:stringent starvation protein B